LIYQTEYVSIFRLNRILFLVEFFFCFMYGESEQDCKSKYKIDHE